jgi:phosphohistidine swiveling domain-containing protein
MLEESWAFKIRRYFVNKNMKSKAKNSWLKIISREYAVQYTELSLKSLSPACAFIVPSAFYNQVYIPDNGNEACFIDEAEWNSFVSALKKRYLARIENYESFERLFMKYGKNYIAVSKRIANENLSKKSNKDLIKLYLTYQKSSLKYAPFIWIQFIINNFFADKAKEILTLKLGGGKELQDLLEFVFRPAQKAASIQLSDIALDWNKMNLKEKTKAYEEFKWIPCLDIHNPPWTKAEFFSHIREFSQNKKDGPSSVSSLGHLNLSKQERKTLDIAKKLSYLKDLKDDFRRQGVFYGQSLFREIAKRMKVKMEDISYMLEDEVIDFLNIGKVVAPSILEERKKGFVIFHKTTKKIVCESGGNIRQVLTELRISVPEELAKEIKGIPASSGQAKGVVTIIKGVSELKKMKKGNILVAITTHPDYVPAMQKAIAIVTEEGGLTSHAAIVSRELGIPCIVGTKIATKVLKDGDRIEVLADKGIVNILEKSK